MFVMEDGISSGARYNALGYKNRDNYLAQLADNLGIEAGIVQMFADMLGPSEDFDGLVSELEDFADTGVFDE